MSVLQSYLPVLADRAIPAVPLVLFFLLLWHFLFFRDWRKSVRYAVYCLFLCVLWIVTGPPDVFSACFAPKINLIPFAGMVRAPLETLCNVLLFVPLGLLLPLLWKRYRDGKNAVLCGLTLSLAVEISQLFSGITDIDDLIANTAGTFLGYLAACGLLLRHPKLAETDGSPWERGLLGATVIAVMFFLAPLVGKLI